MGNLNGGTNMLLGKNPCFSKDVCNTSSLSLSSSLCLSVVASMCVYGSYGNNSSYSGHMRPITPRGIWESSRRASVYLEATLLPLLYYVNTCVYFLLIQVKKRERKSKFNTISAPLEFSREVIFFTQQ